MYLSLQYHRQNDSCLKMGSNESHFNVSWIVRDSPKTVSTDHVWRERDHGWRERTAKADLNWGPYNGEGNHSAYGGKGKKEWWFNHRRQPGKPRMLWTATRTTKMSRQCPLTIAQQVMYCAIAISTAVQNRVTKTMSIAPLLRNNWCKRSPTF